MVNLNINFPAFCPGLLNSATLTGILISLEPGCPFPGPEKKLS
jgi:hypothetical protein